MKELPSDVTAYKKTKVFDEASIPKGLLNDHSTMDGVWGKINVLEGELLYVIQGEPVEKVTLNLSHGGVVEPQIVHHVKPLGKVKFYVEFYR